MPKKNATPATPLPLPKTFEEDERRELEAFEQFAGIIPRLDRLVTFVMRHGIFSIENPAKLHEAIELVGEHEGDLKARDAAIEAHVSAIEAEPLSPKQRRALASLEDETLTTAIEWGEAGYLLGIAVGMRLGPNGLKVAGAR